MRKSFSRWCFSSRWPSCGLRGLKKFVSQTWTKPLLCVRNGTATHSYRGRWNWGLSDERVGLFRAKLDTRDFRRLVALVRGPTSAR